MKLHYVVLVLAALLPGVSAAQSSGEKKQELAKQVQERCTAADKNSDGQLTREEAKAGMPRVFQNFEEIDTGGKGFITLDDLRSYFGQKFRNGKASGSQP